MYKLITKDPNYSETPKPSGKIYREFLEKLQNENLIQLLVAKPSKPSIFEIKSPSFRRIIRLHRVNRYEEGLAKKESSPFDNKPPPEKINFTHTFPLTKSFICLDEVINLKDLTQTLLVRSASVEVEKVSQLTWKITSQTGTWGEIHLDPTKPMLYLNSIRHDMDKIINHHLIFQANISTSNSTTL